MSEMKETSAGAVGGFQVPLSMKQRKEKLDQLIGQAGDLNHGHVLSFVTSLDEPGSEEFGKILDDGDFGGAADRVRQHVVRELVRQRVKEVVRKSKGGDGYVLYGPNKGKKKKARALGKFPTKAAAKRAELARFPPRDPQKLASAKKSLARLNDPRKSKKTKAKKESLVREFNERKLDSLHRRVIARIIKESFFQEEPDGSEWDVFIKKLSTQALGGDKKFQRFQSNIDKKVKATLESSFNAIKKAVPKEVKLKSFGAKKEQNVTEIYLAFSATADNVEVAPIYIYTNESGVPKIELDANAKAALTKWDPQTAKMFRAELVTVQERILDRDESVADAIHSRDNYLAKIEGEIDSFVSGLSPLQVSMLKQLLVKKYRKLK